MTNPPPALVEVTMNLTLRVTPLALAQLLLHSGTEGLPSWVPVQGLMDPDAQDRIEHPAQEELPLNADDLPPLVNAPQMPVEAPDAAPAPSTPRKAGRAPRGKEALTAAIHAQAEGKANGSAHVKAESQAQTTETPPPPPARPAAAQPGALPPSEADLRALLVVLSNRAPGKAKTVISLLEEVGGAPKLLDCPIDTWPAIAAAARSAIEVYGG